MEDSGLSIGQIGKILRARCREIILCFAGCALLALAVSLIMQPTFEAETTLRVKQTKGLADSLLAEMPSGGINNTKQLMLTYAEIVKSRSVVQAMIDKVYSNTGNCPKYEEMSGKITMQPVKDTEILKIRVQANTAGEAQLLANTLVEVFINRLTHLVRSEQSTVKEFIGERLQDSKKELEKAEKALEIYKRDQKIVAPDDETKALLLRMTDVSKLQAENNINIVSSQARLSSLQKQLSQENRGFIADNPLIQQYKSKLADLEVQLVSMTANYTDKHPQVIAVKAAIGETKEKLNAEIAKVVKAEAPSLNPIHQGLLQGKLQNEAELAAATAQRDAISRLLTENERELNKLPAKEQGLAKVMRDVGVSQEIYVMLAKRYEEAKINEVMQPSDVQVIDEALVPQKSIRPRVFLNMFFAGLLGLLGGTGYVLLFEYCNKTIKSEEDISEYLEAVVLGKIPDFDCFGPDVKQGLLKKLFVFKRRNRDEGHE